MFSSDSFKDEYLPIFTYFNLERTEVENCSA